MRIRRIFRENGALQAVYILRGAVNFVSVRSSLANLGLFEIHGLQYHFLFFENFKCSLTYYEIIFFLILSQSNFWLRKFKKFQDSFCLRKVA